MTDDNPDFMRSFHLEIASGLQSSFEFPLEVNGWGIKVKATAHAAYYLQKMLFVNWRLIEVPTGWELFCDRSWVL